MSPNSNQVKPPFIAGPTTSFLCVGESHFRPNGYSSDIMEAPSRRLSILCPGHKIRFGTIGLGLDLARLVWPQDNQVFSLQDQDLASHLPQSPRRQEGKPFEQQPRNFLCKNPVDVLLFEGSQQASSFSKLPEMLQ